MGLGVLRRIQFRYQCLVHRLGERRDIPYPWHGECLARIFVDVTQTVWQAILVVVIGQFIVASVGTLGANIGARSHVGFPVLNRLSWGMRANVSPRPVGSFYYHLMFIFPVVPDHESSVPWHGLVRCRIMVRRRHDEGESGKHSDADLDL